MSEALGLTAGLVKLGNALLQLRKGSDARLVRQDDRKREQARNLIQTTVQRAVEEFIADLRRQDNQFQYVEISAEKLSGEICAIIELELDSPVEVIRETLESRRNALLLQDMAALRIVMPLMERFTKWCELQIPALVAIRRGLGFSEEDCEALRDVWAEHYATYWAWLQRVKDDAPPAQNPR